jgi:hypothetical protein
MLDAAGAGIEVLPPLLPTAFAAKYSEYYSEVKVAAGSSDWLYKPPLDSLSQAYRT